MLISPAGLGLGALPAPREAPLRDLRATKTLCVNDFGAKPDDGADDLPAIQAAFDAAVHAGEASEISFVKGRYHLDPKGHDGQALTLTGAKDIVIDGHGAEIVIRNPQKGFLRLTKCERVIVRDLSIDYDPLPLTQGWVKAVEPAQHEALVELTPGFPTLDKEYFRTGTQRWAVIKDKQNPRRQKAGLPNVALLEDWEKIGERAFRVRFTQWFPLDLVAPGDPYVQIARVNGAATFFALLSERCTFSGIRIFSAPGASYVTLQCSLLNFLRCAVAPREGHWQSTGADGIFCIWHRVGPWIEGCEIDANGDDGVVVKTKGANCIRKIDDHTFVLKGRPVLDGQIGPFPVAPGDMIRVFDPMGGRLIGQAKTVAVERGETTRTALGTAPLTVVFDRDLPGIQPGAEWGSPIFYNDDTVCGGFVVRGNTFRNIRRWGVLCESHDGWIENNLFEGTSAHAVLLINADQGHQDSGGFVSRNITIRGNTFRDCFVQDPRGLEDFAGVVASAVIGIIGHKESMSLRSKIVPWQGHHNLTIEGNRFIDWPAVPALRVGCASGVSVKDNVFERAAPQADRAGAPAIDVFNASDVAVEGNRVEWPRGALRGGIVVDPKSTERIKVGVNSENKE